VFHRFKFFVDKNSLVFSLMLPQRCVRVVYCYIYVFTIKVCLLIYELRNSMKQLEQVIMGRYQIQSHIAQGGMANIYLAYDGEKDQTVAIKMVHEGLSEYSKRFQREVRAMAQLAHDHILPVLDYGQYDSWYYLVTPYIEYGTLNSRLAEGPLTLEEVDPILSQLAAALQFAHEQGVVHRDVKPSNILMDDGNHVYLADFGLVKQVGQETGLTVHGHLIGTPEYMAPELADEGATPRSDVYSLGILLYQMLAGRVPFKANTPMSVYLCQLRDQPEPPTIFNPTIPAEVENVILRSLDKDPRQRYQSAQELYQAYQQAVNGAACRRANVANLVTQVPGIQLGEVNVRIVKQRSGMGRPLLATLLVIGIFVLLNFTLFSGGRNGDAHIANVQIHRPTPIVTKHILVMAVATPVPTATPRPQPTPNNVSAPAVYDDNSGDGSDQDNSNTGSGSGQDDRNNQDNGSRSWGGRGFGGRGWDGEGSKKGR
jgi:serine/threonine protein kinase